MSGKEGVREIFCAYCFMLKRMGVVSLPLANGFLLMWYTNLGRNGCQMHEYDMQS